MIFRFRATTLSIILKLSIIDSRLVRMGSGISARVKPILTCLDTMKLDTVIETVKDTENETQTQRARTAKERVRGRGRALSPLPPSLSLSLSRPLPPSFPYKYKPWYKINSTI